MFVLYAFLVAAAFVVVDLLYIKTFQLSGYYVCRYAQKLSHLGLSLGKKTPLIFTKRAKRLIFIDFFAKFALFLLIFGFCKNFWANFVVTILLLALGCVFVILSFVLAQPIEALIKKRYIFRAQKKLSLCKCKVIAITGSFGKTSVKHFLAQILSTRFSVCASPQSYNTPMGICRTILENLQPTDDFLILEYGAKKQGDIRALCQIFGADYGIITPVGGCHLQSFGSEKILEDTKFELCQNTQNAVIFTAKSQGCLNLYNRGFRTEIQEGGSEKSCKVESCEDWERIETNETERVESGVRASKNTTGENFPRKILTNRKGAFAFAENVRTSRSGSCFMLVLDGEKVECKTSLLSEAAIDNIVQAAAMARVLGMEVAQIGAAIENLKAVEHRLQVIRSGFTTVIDDSYNSNFSGFCEALKTLSLFDGRKIVVSPGIVELGRQQAETNRKIGALVAKTADIFVIMNQTNKTALVQGVNQHKTCARGKTEMIERMETGECFGIGGCMESGGCLECCGCKEHRECLGSGENEKSGKKCEEKCFAKQMPHKDETLRIEENEQQREKFSTSEPHNCQVFFAQTRAQQKELLRKILKVGDIVLFENDLPDDLR